MLIWNDALSTVQLNQGGERRVLKKTQGLDVLQLPPPKKTVDYKPNS